MKTPPIHTIGPLSLAVALVLTASMTTRSGYEVSSRDLVASWERLVEFVRQFHSPRPSRLQTGLRFVGLDSKKEIVFREDTPEIAPWSHDMHGRLRKIVRNESSGVRASIRVSDLADVRDAILEDFGCDYWLSTVVRIDNVQEAGENQSLRVRTIYCDESYAGFTESRYYFNADFRTKSSGHLIQWTVEFLDSVPIATRQRHIERTYADFEIVSSEVLRLQILCTRIGKVGFSGSPGRTRWPECLCVPP